MSQGLVINVSYDSSVNDAPAGFKAAIAAVVQFYETEFTNPITLNIDVGYGEIAGDPLGSGDIGESQANTQNFTYTQIRSALISHATSANQLQAVSTLPSTAPISGTYFLTVADATALGLISGTTTFDGYVGFSSTVPFDYNTTGTVPANEYYFFGDAAHEISEVMGRISGLDEINSFSYSDLDLFRYSAAGVRALSGHASTAYFSINGGTTDLANFNTDPEGDLGDWAISMGNDSYDAFSNSGVVNPVSQADITVMNVLGYDLALGVSAIVEQPGSGVANAGTTVTITLDLNETVTVTGTPTLTLNNGATANYTGGSGSTALAFSYTVAVSDANVPSLTVTAIDTDAGAILAPDGSDADLTVTGLSQSGPQIYTTVNYVDQVYEAVLLRQPSAGEVAGWATALDTSSLTRIDVAADFVGSAEAQEFVLPVVRLYQGFFDRAPDPGGLNAWVNALRSGTPLNVIAGDFAASPEFQQDYPAGTTPTSFVTALYENILAREPDSGGEQNWVNFLTQNNDSAAARATVVLGFADSPEFINDSTAPIDAWLTSAGETGTYAATIAYQSVEGTSLEAVTMAAEATPVASSLPGTPTIVPISDDNAYVFNVPTTGDQSFDLQLQNDPTVANAATATFTGGESGQVVTLDQGSIPTDIGTIDASALASNLVLSPDARVNGGDGSPPPLHVIGGSGSNTIELANAGDVLDGGSSGHNTLIVDAATSAGAIGIDLSAAAGADEVTSFAGAATLPTATDFQNVDLSDLTGGPAGATVIASPNGSTIIDSQYSDNVVLATTGTGNDTIALSGNGFAPINAAAPAGGVTIFTQFASVANFDAAGTDLVALTIAYAAGLTNGVAGAASIAQVNAGAIDTTAAGGGHNVFFIMPAAAVALTSATSVEAAIGAVKTNATDTFVVILDNAPSAAASTGFGVYEVTANDVAAALLGSNPADQVKLIGLFAAAGGFADHNYHAPIAGA